MNTARPTKQMMRSNPESGRNMEMSQNTKRKISPAVQDRTQAGKVALGEPAVGRQHAEIQRGQREHGEQDLNVVSEKDRGKRDAR